MGKEQPRSFFAEQWLSLEKPKKMMQSPFSSDFCCQCHAADRLYKIALSASPASEWQRVVGRAALEQKTLKLFILDASLFLCIPQRAKLLKTYLRFDNDRAKRATFIYSCMYEYTRFLYFEKDIAPRPLADVRV